jgi:hypothetical protein
MKKVFIFLMTTCFAVSCSEFDDSDIWDKLNDHEYRIAYLEEVCNKMNADIVNLQTIVTGLETNDYIVSASPLQDGSGYVLIFRSGKSIIINHGKDGTDGKDGIDGKNGVTPAISVMKDVDGIYYWTINGEWLLINGEKVRASAVDGSDGKDGVDGTDGANGNDGITPQFKIENNYWYISYDNGASWEMLGKATGSNGLDGINGTDGDSMFKRVYVEDGYVCFELNDNVNTIIRIPLMKDGTLQVVLKTAGTLSEVLTSEETRVTTSLVVKGRINEDDMKHIQIMNSLHTLDLRDAYYEVNDNDNNKSTLFAINPYRDIVVNKSLVVLYLPKESETYDFDLSYCLSLREVMISSPSASFYTIDNNGYRKEMELCYNIRKVEFAEGITNSDDCYTIGHWPKIEIINALIYPSTMVNIPMTITCFANNYTSESVIKGGVRNTKEKYRLPNNIVCKALVPPTVEDLSDGGYIWEYDVVEKSYKEIARNGSSTTIYKIDMTDDNILYVPRESMELYRTAPLWEIFTNIRAIEDME